MRFVQLTLVTFVMILYYTFLRFECFMLGCSCCRWCTSTELAANFPFHMWQTKLSCVFFCYFKNGNAIWCAYLVAGWFGLREFLVKIVFSEVVAYTQWDTVCEIFKGQIKWWYTLLHIFIISTKLLWTSWRNRSVHMTFI